MIMTVMLAASAQLLVTTNYGQVLSRKTYPTYERCMRAANIINNQRTRTTADGITVTNLQAPLATCIPS